MTYRVSVDGVERDATPEEIAEIEARVPAPVVRHITELALRKRFTTAEKVAIEMAAIDDPAKSMEVRQQAAALRVYLADLRSAAFVDLDFPDTRAGVQDLEATGVIAPGRAAQILDAEITPDELPL